jgi:hypothetical protein
MEIDGKHKYPMYRPWSGMHYDAAIEDYAISEADYKWSEIKHKWSRIDRFFGCLQMNKGIVKVKEELFNDSLDSILKFISEKGIELGYRGRETDYLVINAKDSNEADNKLSNLKKDFKKKYHTPLYA